MPTIQLHINGLTHHDIAERRAEFLRTAVGRRMVLRTAPCREDERAVAAYVGRDMVGYVARTGWLWRRACWPRAARRCYRHGWLWWR